MAELTQKERLQPSLLDRLTDDEPDQQQEARDKRVLSMRKLRECVLRDMAWLLNTSNLEAVQNLDDYPYVKHAVVNYGISDISGHAVVSADVVSMEQNLRQAIWDFEPRIIRNSVSVRIQKSDEQMNQNSMTFEIEGDLWAQPLPQRLYLKTVVDLEMNIVEVKDTSG